MPAPWEKYQQQSQAGQGPWTRYQQPQEQAVQEVAQDPSVLQRAEAVGAGFNRGVAGIAGLPVDTLRNVIDLGKAGIGSVYTAATGRAPPEALTVNEDRSNIWGSSQNIAKLMDKAKIATAPPRPDDPASRYLYAAGAGASGGLLAPASGAAVLPAMVSGASGSLASQFAAERGGGPGMQLLAGMAGAMAPSAIRYGAQEGARMLLRGGEQGRQKTAQNIQDFENAGTTPSMGQATESRGLRATESLGSRTPGAAGVLANKAKNQAEQIGGNIERLARELSPSASAEQAGRAIDKGITGTGGFVETFKKSSAANYDTLDKFVSGDSPVSVTNTEATLNKLAASIPGAENTSGAFVNSRIASIRDALKADISANDAGNNPAILRNESQGLPYAALKQLRTIVGNELADAPFGGDVPASQWKRIYAAMSADMEAAAEAAGPAAVKALNRANAYHKAGMQRLDTISSVISKNGGPEAVFKAATSGAKEGATTLRAVMQSLPPDGQKAVSAGVLRRLGRALPGAQNETGEVFSTERFLTNWNSLSPQAKTTLFDRYGNGFRADMDAIAKVAANLREGSAVFRNPSGTAQAVGQTAAATTFLGALLTGHPVTAAGVAVGVGTSNISARVMTNPNAVKWLAQSTRAPKSAVPALLARASQSNDVTLQDLAQTIKESQADK